MKSKICKSQKLLLSCSLTTLSPRQSRLNFAKCTNVPDFWKLRTLPSQNAANPRRKLGPRRPKTGRPSKPEFPKKPKPFDNTDKTDRKKIISDRIRKNKIKDRLDKLKEKMKAGPIGAGLNPDKLKKSIKNLKNLIIQKLVYQV